MAEKAVYAVHRVARDLMEIWNSPFNQTPQLWSVKIFQRNHHQFLLLFQEKFYPAERKSDSHWNSSIGFESLS